MLTGRETIPAAFAATAWRDGWSDLAARVRWLALGLGDAGTLPMPTTPAAALAVLAAGGVLDLDAPVAALDEDALVAAGRAVDEREPDAHERRWQAIAPSDPAALGDGGLTWSHAGLLWAARSVAQLLGAGPGDRIRLDDPLDGPRRLVLETLVPAVSGATIAGGAPDVLVVAAAAIVERLRPHVDAMPAGRLRARGAAREARGALGLDRCRLVLVTGDGGVAVDWLALLGVRAAELVIVPGCASPVRAGAPLPGVTIATNDAGEVLVRAEAVAAAAVGDDGWLHGA